METFSAYWPFVQGIHRSPVNSPHKGQWRGALMFSLICTWINGWVNNREAGDLGRHCAHYDITVMGHSFACDVIMHISEIWWLGVENYLWNMAPFHSECASWNPHSKKIWLFHYLCVIATNFCACIYNSQLTCSHFVISVTDHWYSFIELVKYVL